jgi:hypothetical protein
VKPELQAELSNLTAKALDAAAFARDWRNRHIAHKDLPLALGDQTALPLKPASQLAVEEALKPPNDLLNAIDLSYNDATTMFTGTPPHNGAERLLGLLQKGLEAEHREELESKGKWSLE